MPNSIRRVGPEYGGDLKIMRRAADMTIATLADEARIDADRIASFERGEIALDVTQWRSALAAIAHHMTTRWGNRT